MLFEGAEAGATGLVPIALEWAERILYLALATLAQRQNFAKPVPCALLSLDHAAANDRFPPKPHPFLASKTNPSRFSST